MGFAPERPGCFHRLLLIGDPAVEDVEQEPLDRAQVRVEIRQVAIPARTVARGTRRVGMNVRPARRGEHRQAFAEGFREIARQRQLGRQAFALGAGRGIADVMELVRGGVLELLRRSGRIEVEDDGGRLLRFEDEAVVARLDQDEDTRANGGIGRKVCVRAPRGFAQPASSPLLERALQRGLLGDGCRSGEEFAEISVGEGALHRFFTPLEKPVAFAVEEPLPQRRRRFIPLVLGDENRERSLGLVGHEPQVIGRERRG